MYDAVPTPSELRIIYPHIICIDEVVFKGIY